MQRIDSLIPWGWTPERSVQLETTQLDHPDLVPARLVSASREIYRVQMPDAERTARPSGTLRSTELPAVGDWVLCDPEPSLVGETVVRCVLPRRTRLSRKVSGSRTEEQLVAANVDAVFLVMGVDGDFNLRRLERFAVMAWESGADPVVVLTKADLAEDGEDAMELRFEAEDVAPGMPVHLTSSLRGEGLDPLRAYLGEGRTVALLGSSGAGKSTLLNALCGEEVMATGAVREGDDRGRHTTTHRQLVRLPGGGLLIDNPGVREIQLWSGDEALGDAFGDVEALVAGCRFRDCRHEEEPGCAVLRAVEEGDLPGERLASYRGLLRELRHLELKQNVAARRQENKRMSKLYRSVQSANRRRKGMG